MEAKYTDRTAQQVEVTDCRAVSGPQAPIIGP
jgi:hypothetical protein